MTRLNCRLTLQTSNPPPPLIIKIIRDMELKENQIKVLRVFAGLDNTDYYLPFKPIVEETGLERREVRLICRRLKRLGLLDYKNGLISDWDGTIAGAGYGLTEIGKSKIDELQL